MSLHCDPIQVQPPRRAAFASRMAILIPAHNEARHLSGLIARCRDVGPALILVVDDGSTDTTPRVLTAEAERDSAVELHWLRCRPNRGKQGAVRVGLRWLGHRDLDGVALLDGDGQHDPYELPGLATLLDAYDLVIGVRSQRSMPPQRRLSNFLVNLGFQLIGGVDFVDVQSGLRLYRPELAAVLAAQLPDRGGYGLEHRSLQVLAQYARQRRRHLRAAAAPISCAYGNAESGITVRSIVRLTGDTFRRAASIRWAGRRALVGAV